MPRTNACFGLEMMNYNSHLSWPLVEDTLDVGGRRSRCITMQDVGCRRFGGPALRWYSYALDASTSASLHCSAHIGLDFCLQKALSLCPRYSPLASCIVAPSGVYVTILVVSYFNFKIIFLRPIFRFNHEFSPILDELDCVTSFEEDVPPSELLIFRLMSPLGRVPMLEGENEP